ncbi:MAG TPA: transglutaminase family protein [Polyangiales bacterium]
MRRLRIEHLTEYRFPSTVQLLPHRLLLRPREDHNLRIASSKLDIAPAAQLRWQRDPLDNSIVVASFRDATRTLSIRSEVIVEHYDAAPLDFLVEPYAATTPFAYTDAELLSLAPYRAPSWPQDRATVASWLSSQGQHSGARDTFSVLDGLNRSIPQLLRYASREEAGVQSPALTLARGTGSCRDFAALFMDACRALGFACRFVSGYHTSYANEVGPGSTHAWAEVYIPGPGWKGFDPTAGVVTGNQHIAVAFAVHPELVPPISGSYLGSAEPKPSLHVFVRVVGA